MLRSGQLLGDTWEVIGLIGRGTFSELYVGTSIFTDEYVAIKVQNKDYSGSILKSESVVLQALAPSSCTPHLIYFGSHPIDYLVMTLYAGGDLSTLRPRHDRDRLPPAIVAHLGIQMLYCLKHVHEKGYVHRDVKPSNFLRVSMTENKLCLVDFGITKKYLDESGAIRPARPNSEFRGTTMFASPHSHCNDQAPRDDIYSLVHIVLDLMCGSLPWSGALRQKDKQSAISIKNESWGTDQADLLTFITANCDTHTMDIILEPLRVIMEHTASLKYEDMPNYPLIAEQLRAIMEKYSVTEQQALVYQLPQYQRSDALRHSVIQDQIDTYPKQVNASGDELQTLISFKCDILLQKLHTGCIINTGVANRWYHIARLLGKVQSSEVQVATLELCNEVLKQCEFFVNLDARLIDMEEYMELQRAIYRFRSARQRILMRPF